MIDGDRPELLQYAFTDRRARVAVVDWGMLADALVTWLHLHSGPETQQDIAELSISLGKEFTTRWEKRPTGSPSSAFVRSGTPRSGWSGRRRRC